MPTRQPAAQQRASRVRGAAAGGEETGARELRAPLAARGGGGLRPLSPLVGVGEGGPGVAALRVPGALSLAVAQVPRPCPAAGWSSSSWRATCWSRWRTWGRCPRPRGWRGEGADVQPLAGPWRPRAGGVRAGQVGPLLPRPRAAAGMVLFHQNGAGAARTTGPAAPGKSTEANRRVVYPLQTFLVFLLRDSCGAISSVNPLSAERSQLRVGKGEKKPFKRSQGRGEFLGFIFSVKY